MEFKIKPEQLAQFCLSSDWRIYEPTVNIISSLSKLETEVFYRAIFSKSYKPYDLKVVMNYLYSALKKSNTFYAIHLYYALALADLKNNEFYKNNSIRRFINLVFSKLEVSEETYIEKYEALKPFKYSIFKGNPKLKVSETAKCLEVISGENNQRSKSNIKIYLENKTPNKICSFRNVSVNGLLEFPALVNWRDIILKNKISDSEYKRIPSEYEEIFKHYMEYDRSYFSNTNKFADLELTKMAAYSWDVFNYYFLYCFDLNDATDVCSNKNSLLAIVFLDPKKAMEINKKNYLTIVNRNVCAYLTKGHSESGKSVSITVDKIEGFVNSPDFLEWRQNIYNVKNRTDLFSWSSSWNNWGTSISSLYYYGATKLCNVKELFDKYF